MSSSEYGRYVHACRPDKRCLYSFWVASLFLSLFAISLVSQAQTSAPQNRRPFKVKVELTVYDAPVIVERVLACEMRQRMHPGPASGTQELKRRSIWAPNVRNFYTQLSDESVLVIYTPQICDEHSGRIKPLSPGYVPAMVWLSSKSNFQQVEFFVSPRYFNRADARVRFKRMEILNADKSDLVESDHEFDRLRFAGRRMTQSTALSRLYLGAYVVAYPERVWRENHRLSTYLDSLTSFSRLRGESRLRDVFKLREYPHTFQNELEGRGIAFASESRADYLAAARLEGEVWNADARDEGVVRLHHQPNIPVNHHRLDSLLRELRDAVIRIDGQRVEDKLPMSFFDPEKKQLYLISLEYLIW
jgi:hypothetical protein